MAALTLVEDSAISYTTGYNLLPWPLTNLSFQGILKIMDKLHLTLNNVCLNFSFLLNMIGSSTRRRKYLSVPKAS